MLKRFLAAGYPVLIEKGIYLHDLTGVVSWMGHYLVVTGYDETEKYFIAQDSYVGADQKVPYEDMVRNWRAFNYTYLVIYSADKEAEVLALLGPDADETANYQNAALKAAKAALMNAQGAGRHTVAEFRQSWTDKVIDALSDYHAILMSIDDGAT